MSKDIRTQYEYLKTNRFNVKYDDFLMFLKLVGFEHLRTKGDHDIFKHEKDDMLTLQPKKGDAKPYQIRDAIKKIAYFKLIDGV